MHKMMLVVSLKTAEGTLCMVLHSIAQHTISMVLHSIVQYGIAWLSLSRQRKGLQWPLQPNKEAPTSCLQNPEIKNQKKKNSGRDSSGHFTTTKRPQCMSWVSCLRNTQKKLENNKCYCQVTNLRCQQRAVSRLWSQFYFIASTAAEILRMFCKMEITSEYTR